jgi:hypothetical protein
LLRSTLGKLYLRRTGIYKQKKRENEMSPGLLERCRKRKRKAFFVSSFIFQKQRKKVVH